MPDFEDCNNPQLCIAFPFGADLAGWPELFAGDVNELALRKGSLRMDGDREIRFLGEGRLTTSGSLKIVTGDPAVEALTIQPDGSLVAASGLKILAGESSTEALRIEADGKVGIGGVAPNQALEVNGGVRVSGAVNAGAFLQNGFPLRLSQWDNTSNGIRFTAGNVGIGTFLPEVKLQVVGGTDAETATRGGFLVLGNMNGPNLALDDNEIIARNNGRESTLHFQANGGDVWLHSKGPGASQVIIKDSGRVGIGGIEPQAPLHVFPGAKCNGTKWLDASSITYKKDVAPLSLETALETLTQLTPVTFAYKHEEGETHVGFIAEDVPELVATRDRQTLSAMDIVGVLTRVVQQQQREIEALRARLEQEGH